MAIQSINVGTVPDDGTGDSLVTMGGKVNANFDFMYEAGTWTPTLRGDGATSGQTYSKQRGDFVRMGDLVTVSFDVQLSNKGTTSGVAVVEGLPFPLLDVADSRWVGPMFWVSLTSNLVSALLSANNGRPTQIVLYGVSAAAASLAALDSGVHLGNTSRVLGSLVYIREP